jgi:signal transduction histidine kinase
LTAARLQAQGLARELADADREQTTVKALPAKVAMIGRQLNRLETLVDLLLDASRSDRVSIAERREPIDLGELVRGTVTLMRDDGSEAAPPIAVSAAHPVLGLWDRAAIETVVRNLLSNAIKFSCNQPIEVSVGQLGDRAVLAVRDHGVGIAAENQERIFGKFERAVTTRNYGGWGIGLWLARRYVDAEGGTIRVDSEENEGATFTVELPLPPLVSAVVSTGPAPLAAGEDQASVSRLR